MNPEAAQVRRTYLLLILLSTLASSFIWGINTLFLLSAGLTNTQAFLVNAFYTAGAFLFEVPTGVVADTRGRRTSYLWGTITLLFSTLLYLLMWQTQAPVWGWAIASILLGLGFTFFSGATEAWLVDALDSTGYDGPLEEVLARGQVVSGGAMLVGAVAGGVVAQFSSLAVPYVIRAVLLGLTFVVALRFMHDLGFTRMDQANLVAEVKSVLTESVRTGLGNPNLRWLILSSFFLSGVAFYGFYAMQPYLLQLYGDESAFGLAGLAAAVFAGAQILGGLVVPWIQKIFSRRTTAILVGTSLSTLSLVMVGLGRSFWLVATALMVWSFFHSAVFPVRQAFLNGCIPSSQRATVLSLDALVGSAGGAVAQPFLGRVADRSGYGPSYLVAAAIHAVALPFIYLARRQDSEGERAEAARRADLIEASVPHRC
ncbi:MAG TPA: MFS transporter [Acidimicrobiia bacterium]|nr:MFS transporter [Acidimicrobiia bacterium]